MEDTAETNNTPGEGEPPKEGEPKPKRRIIKKRKKIPPKEDNSQEQNVPDDNVELERDKTHEPLSKDGDVKKAESPEGSPTQKEPDKPLQEGSPTQHAKKDVSNPPPEGSPSQEDHSKPPPKRRIIKKRKKISPKDGNSPDQDQIKSEPSGEGNEEPMTRPEPSENDKEGHMVKSGDPSEQLQELDKQQPNDSLPGEPPSFKNGNDTTSPHDSLSGESPSLEREIDTPPLPQPRDSPSGEPPSIKNGSDSPPSQEGSPTQQNDPNKPPSKKLVKKRRKKSPKGNGSPENEVTSSDANGDKSTHQAQKESTPASEDSNHASIDSRDKGESKQNVTRSQIQKKDGSVDKPLKEDNSLQKDSDKPEESSLEKDSPLKESSPPNKSDKSLSKEESFNESTPKSNEPNSPSSKKSEKQKQKSQLVAEKTPDNHLSTQISSNRKTSATSEKVATPPDKGHDKLSSKPSPSVEKVATPPDKGHDKPPSEPSPSVEKVATPPDEGHDKSPSKPSPISEKVASPPDQGHDEPPSEPSPSVEKVATPPDEGHNKSPSKPASSVEKVVTPSDQGHDKPPSKPSPSSEKVASPPDQGYDKPPPNGRTNPSKMSLKSRLKNKKKKGKELTTNEGQGKEPTPKEDHKATDRDTNKAALKRESPTRPLKEESPTGPRKGGSPTGQLKGENPTGSLKAESPTGQLQGESPTAPLKGESPTGPPKGGSPTGLLQNERYSPKEGQRKSHVCIDDQDKPNQSPTNTKERVLSRPQQEKRQSPIEIQIEPVQQEDAMDGKTIELPSIDMPSGHMLRPPSSDRVSPKGRPADKPIEISKDSSNMVKAVPNKFTAPPALGGTYTARVESAKPKDRRNGHIPHYLPEQAPPEPQAGKLGPIRAPAHLLDTFSDGSDENKSPRLSGSDKPKDVDDRMDLLKSNQNDPNSAAQLRPPSGSRRGLVVKMKKPHSGIKRKRIRRRKISNKTQSTGSIDPSDDDATDAGDLDVAEPATEPAKDLPCLPESPISGDQSLAGNTNGTEVVEESTELKEEDTSNDKDKDTDIAAGIAEKPPAPQEKKGPITKSNSKESLTKSSSKESLIKNKKTKLKKDNTVTKGNVKRKGRATNRKGIKDGPKNGLKDGLKDGSKDKSRDGSKERAKDGSLDPVSTNDADSKDGSRDASVTRKEGSRDPSVTRKDGSRDASATRTSSGSSGGSRRQSDPDVIPKGIGKDTGKSTVPCLSQKPSFVVRTNKATKARQAKGRGQDDKEMTDQTPGGGGGSAPGSAETGPKNAPSQPRNRILHCSLKGDWIGVDGTLRSANRGDADLTAADPETGITPLMLAAGENKLAVVERLLELGVHLNERAKDGRTAIHFAALTAKDDMMRMLISRKADATLIGGPLDRLPIHMASTRFSGGLFHVQSLLKVFKDARLATDKDGNIPLILAAESGNLALGRELLSTEKEEQLKVRRKTNGDTALHAACRKKDFDFIKLCVDCGSEIDAKNKDGQSPLHLSAAEGDEAAIKFFYQSRANPHIFDKLDRSPVHLAAEHGHTQVVELLVEKFKASVSARTKDGSTLMHVASTCGHPETALMFLKKGVPLHMPNKSGAVCLHAASTRGHTAVVKALLQKGAQVDARTKDNYTALHLAVEHCKPLVVQTLLGHGAQVQLKGGRNQETPLHIAARIKDGEKVAEMLLKSGADVNVAMSNGETAIHIASRHGFLKMVQELLEEGADPVCLSKAGENPLHIAIRHCHLPVVKELINFLHNEMSMMDVVLAVNAQSQEGESPLHYAAEITKDMIHYPNEDIEIITTMLKYDADINIITKLTQETPLHYCSRAGNADILMQMVNYLGPNRTQLAVNRQCKNGWSPLLVASEQGHVEIVKILLQHNARVDVFDEHGKAALHLGAENGHLEVADILLWHKAFVNAKSKLGVTPLHLAAQNGHNELVKLLIQTHKATIDALSLVKKTPLHMAAQNGMLEVCEMLLKMTADSNAADIHGQTPLHLAAENDHADIVKFFLKHKPEIVTLANSDGSTCAHIAASKGSVAVIKELLRFDRIGVTMAKNKTNDSTSLHLAAAGGHKEVINVLVDAGANPTEEDGEGMTAIHLSAKNGHVGSMEVLKSKVSLKTTSVKTGLAALHIAAHYGQADFVREMLTKVPATIRSETPTVIPADMKDLPLNDHGFTPLHLAAQSGHEGLVRLLLNSPGVQPDVPTIVQGCIPLHLAAQSGHSAVVGLLLSKSTTQLHVKDKRGRTGLHLAAANGRYDMVALLLGQGSDINTFDKNGWTALHFAAKAGFLNVVKLLVESGASPKFETKDGKVPICYAAAANHHLVISYLMKQDHNTYHLMEDKKFVFDLMVSGKYTNNKSLQEFILRSHAPIDAAGKLSRNFTLMSTKEKERARELLDAATFCESMAVDLLSVAASVSSAGSLLKAVDNRGVTMLDVLIECEQKEVIAHPSVQRYLSDVWIGGLKWSGFKIIMLFFSFIIFPPIWVFFSLPIKQRFNKLPIIKFMSLVVSHIYLILLLCMTTVVTEFIEQFIVSTSLIPRWYEWFLLAWLSGLLLSEITNPEDRAGLGWIRVVILVLAAIACTLHVVAFGFVNKRRVQELIYVRNQLLAWGLLLSFAQILEFLIFHHLFGPWAIIIRDLMKDLVRFMVILLIFLVGFMLHLAAVYQPVYAKTGNDSNDQQYIQSPADTFPILFFSLFGLVEPIDLPSTGRHPGFTHILIRIVFGVYLIVTLIVLINLLIAMMSDTYQRIQAQSDTEWKFGRAKLIRKMNKSSTTPSPINLFTKAFTYLKAAFKHRGLVCSAQARQYINQEEELDAISDSRSVDMFGGGGGGTGGVGWLRNTLGGGNRRSTQVAPEGGFMRAGNTGPQRIEDVVDWDNVGKRYLSIKGEDEEEDVNQESMGAGDGESNGNAVINKD